MRALMAYPWPGNVRQLENAVERAVALSAGRQQIELSDLPAEVHVAPPSTQAPFVELPEDGLDLPAYLAAIERDLIQRSSIEQGETEIAPQNSCTSSERRSSRNSRDSDSNKPMPPRFSYWTILAGGLPTSFRAAERDDLLPTLRRLQERHPDAEMKWFQRGKLWASPEAAKATFKDPLHPADATGDPAGSIGIRGSRSRSTSGSATRRVANSGSIASKADPSRNRRNARNTNQSDRELIAQPIDRCRSTRTDRPGTRSAQGPIDHGPIATSGSTTHRSPRTDRPTDRTAQRTDRPRADRPRGSRPRGRAQAAIKGGRRR